MQAMRQAWAETLLELLQEDPNGILLDADLASSTKADLIAAELPGQFLQLGIAEQNMVGVAAGLAASGMTPWASTFGAFMSHRAADPIRVVVSQTKLPVKLAAGYTGMLFGMAGKSHHDISDVAWVRSLPSMTLLSPGDAEETRVLTRWAHKEPVPVYLRLTRDPVPTLPGNINEANPLAPRRIVDGNQVTFVATGSQSARCVEAAEQLNREGISTAVVHLPCLSPLSGQAVADAIGDTTLVVTAEEHAVSGGVGTIVMEALMDAGRAVPVRRLGLTDWVVTASNDYLLDKHGLSVEGLVNAVHAEMARN